MWISRLSRHRHQPESSQRTIHTELNIYWVFFFVFFAPAYLSRTDLAHTTCVCQNYPFIHCFVHMPHVFEVIPKCPFWSFFFPLFFPTSLPPHPWSDFSFHEVFRAGENLPFFSIFLLSKVDNNPSPLHLLHLLSLQVKMPYGCGRRASWGAGWRRGGGGGEACGCFLPVLFLLSPAVFPSLLPPKLGQYEGVIIVTLSSCFFSRWFLFSSVLLGLRPCILPHLPRSPPFFFSFCGYLALLFLWLK